MTLAKVLPQVKSTQVHCGQAGNIPLPGIAGAADVACQMSARAPTHLSVESLAFQSSTRIGA